LEKISSTSKCRKAAVSNNLENELKDVLEVMGLDPEFRDSMLYLG